MNLKILRLLFYNLIEQGYSEKLISCKLRYRFSFMRVDDKHIEVSSHRSINFSACTA